jgi:hypothetical protein
MRTETTFNLVREQNDDTYRVVDDTEMFLLRARNQVVFEKSRVDGRKIGFFYIQKA